MMTFGYESTLLIISDIVAPIEEKHIGMNSAPRVTNAFRSWWQPSIQGHPPCILSLGPTQWGVRTAHRTKSLRTHSYRQIIWVLTLVLRCSCIGPAGSGKSRVQVSAGAISSPCLTLDCNRLSTVWLVQSGLQGP